MLATLLYLAIACGTFLAISFLGAPVALALRLPLWHVVAPLSGLAVLCTGAWFGLERLQVTAGAVAATLFAAAAVCLAVVAAASTAQQRREALRPDRRALLTALPFALTSLVYLVYYRHTLGDFAPLPVTLGNADLAFHAVLGQHLATTSSFLEPGPIVGSHLGHNARVDVTGVFVLLGAASWLTGISVAALLMPTLLLGVALCAVALAHLVHRFSGLGVVSSALIATLASSSGMFYYGVTQGFLSQYYGMAAAFMALAATAALPSTAPRALWRHVGVHTVSSSVLLFFYPHMAFLWLPLVIGVPTLLSLLLWRQRQERPRLLALVGPPVTGLVLAGLLAPARFLEAAQRTFVLRDVTAGWTLPRVDPLQMVGLAAFPSKSAMSQPAAPLEPGELLTVLPVVKVVALAAIPIVGLAVMVWIARHGQRSALWLASTLFVLGSSYVAMYAYYGVSYQQWKWALFLQPALAAAGLALVLLGLRAVARRVSALAGSWRGVEYSVLALLLVAVVSRGSHALSPEVRLEPELRAVATAAAQDGPVNLQFGGPTGFWDTMWGVFYSYDTQIFPVSTSYFAPQEPSDGGTTVTRRGTELVVLPDSEFVGPVAGERVAG